MYRILKFRSIIHNKSCGNSFKINSQTTSKICSFCCDYHLKIPKTINYLSLRQKSTTINPALLPVSKVVKKKPIKYTDLVEEKNSNISNRKARVRNVTASHFSQLVNQPDTNLGQKTNSASYSSSCQVNSDNIADNSTKFYEKSLIDKDDPTNFLLQQDKFDRGTIIEDLQSSGVNDVASAMTFYNSIKEKQDKCLEEDESEHTTTETTTTTTTSTAPTTTETKETTAAVDKSVKLKTTKQQQQENEKEKYKFKRGQLQIESLNRSLKAYLRVCISSGMFGRAYHTIMHYRRKGYLNKESNILIDTSLWNVILQPYAASGNLTRVKEFWQILKKDKLEPTAKTFSGIYECYSNVDNENIEPKFLQQVYSQMTTMGITFDDVLNASRTRLDQYNKVLKTIRLLMPDFKPASLSKIESYNCSLLDNNLFDFDNIINNKKCNNKKLEEEKIRDKFRVQIANEVEGQVVIKSIEKFNNEDDTVVYFRNEVSKLEKNWKSIVFESFIRNIKNLKNDEHSPIASSMVLYPYLSVLSPQEYVNAVLYEVKRLAIGSETFSPTLRSLWRDLGKYINDKYEISEKKKLGYNKALELVYIDWYKNRNTNVNNRISWELSANKKSHNFDLELESIRWPTNVHINIGQFLYRIIFDDLKIDVNSVRPKSKQTNYQQAFFEINRSCGMKHSSKEIKPHPVLSKIYRQSKPETLSFPSSLIPVECPARPWTSIYSGGYLISRSDVVRVPQYAMEQWKRLEQSKNNQLLPSLDSLNQLASIPWTVNTKILDIQIKVFQDGGSDKLNVPRPRSSLLPVESIDKNASNDERKSYYKATLEYSQKKNEMYSLWCDALYRLSLANHFRNKIIWLPHNMDFRGRVYPIPPHLNHLGSDLARSILIFADGKPLGKNGLDWLKIHCINLTGLKKRESIANRLAYANEIIDTIIDSAKNPLDGNMWWVKSDEPWQTLAACTEIEAALKSSNPENYISHFPIHQDGSCNGLQHYAALGRDQIGAENVNLRPSEVPQDVYSRVATMVDELRKKDADNGLDTAQLLDGYVTRKVIKQTVMTTVYGVTKFGARLQIAKQLDNLDFPKEYVWKASLYLAEKTFESLRTMFDSARQIQDWFTDCAQMISDKKRKNVEWTTPLGLPVVQPYSKKVPTKSKMIEIATDSWESPNISKQKSAFAPNFIHSLDSCHMMLTSLHCEKAGITFVSVHDCYWTHPCTVEIMNKICREQFVALHSQPILENLSQSFVNTYLPSETPSNDDKQNQNNMDLTKILMERKASREDQLLHALLTKIPKKGHFNLSEVLKSTYFFS
ncbi:hypothetical protein HCN44_001922 [Aphidius gifuensis]|uniref:DNA-directed RNA polymerase n=1 Tax=Aphidius gifuensis TaxID=684658 RepID=A0A835CX93_APHGI|nr:DNA-directed RNA polymerase, mitochondrial [Aphidius gifuensis]XP_044021314.1 DNA-directed RNA polymerase, mitochondrial [Aphidius gifuensis]KAF7996290.1 hypothetical protein HCN44_001922 [Aphidius gifuensis]